MKKDKEWLKDKIRSKSESTELFLKLDGCYNILEIKDTVVNELIDQLEEPEMTEEQAWRVIAETHNQDESYWLDVKNRYISSIIESNQIEPPVVPKFIADFIQSCKKQGYNIYGAIKEGVESPYRGEREVSDWLNSSRLEEEEKSNQDKFAMAWLYGYEVEKEQLYYVKRFSETNYLYFSKINVYCDEGYNYNSSSIKRDALKFPKEQAQVLATFVGGEIEEVAK